MSRIFYTHKEARYREMQAELGELNRRYVAGEPLEELRRQRTPWTPEESQEFRNWADHQMGLRHNIPHCLRTPVTLPQDPSTTPDPNAA